MTELDGLVVRAQSGFYDVETAEGTRRAVLRGLLRKERRAEGLAVLGDRVRIRLTDPGDRGDGAVDATITEVLPRGPSLRRRAPGPRGVWAQDVVVANVDLLLPVISVRDPAPGFGLLDRFLALAEIDEVDSVIVANKVDLGIAEAVAERLSVYRAIGYTVIECSARSGAGIEQLRGTIKDRLSAFVGASGVGKSSLLNAIEPGLAKAVGEISTSTGKGRHTTRVGVLHTLSFGGRVADTPGLRELGLWEADQGELEWAYVEFRPYLNRCRYPDCTHVHEPGCAVRAAVASGAVDAERHASYVRLLAEEEP